MVKLAKLMILAATLAVVGGCAKPAAPPAPDTAADTAAVKAVNESWFKAHHAGDADALAALYTEDAVLMAPGAPSSQGRAAIREAYAKDLASMAAAGLTNNDGASSDVGVSGDLGWQSGTFAVTDKSGATVDAGKYLTVFQRKDGKWMIIRDTWNSDAAPAAPAPAPEASAAPAQK